VVDGGCEGFNVFGLLTGEIAAGVEGVDADVEERASAS
jgi:hypothetical protein